MKNRLCLFSVCMAVVLTFNGMAILFSLWSHLFGKPALGIFFGTIGFLVTFLSGWLYSSRSKRIAQECTPLADAYPVLKFIKPLILVLQVLVYIALLGAFLGFSFSWNRGIYDTDYSIPIFAARDSYYLTNHGTRIAVSAFDFILNGASFQVAWHSGTFAVSLYIWKTLVYGESKQQAH